MSNMQLLTTIKAKDVDPNSPHFEYESFTYRPAVRAVVQDEDGRIALMYIKKWDYYMLPGGGIDEGEDNEHALSREILEELGCEVEVKEVLGKIETYFDRWQQKQVDYCFVAQKLKNANAASLSPFENEERFEQVWAQDLQHAYHLLTQSSPENRDGKLVQARDVRFLEYWIEMSRT